MLSKRFLRVLIVAQLALTIFGAVVSYYTQSLLPEPLFAYQSAQFESDITRKELV
jgi:hypothetical protein